MAVGGPPAPFVMLDQEGGAVHAGGANRPTVVSVHAGHPEQFARAGIHADGPLGPNVVFNQRPPVVSSPTAQQSWALRQATLANSPGRALGVATTAQDPVKCSINDTPAMSSKPTAQQSVALTQVTPFNRPAVGLGRPTMAQ